jgi:S1-C subfamily serine protease
VDGRHDLPERLIRCARQPATVRCGGFMTAPAHPTLVSLSADLNALVASASPRLVSVSARHGRPSNGFVFDDGLVLAPAHAVHREHDIVVRAADGSRYAATLAGRDHTTNVAVLQVDTLAGFGAVAASESVSPGDLLVALARDPQREPLAALCLVQQASGPMRAWRGQAYDRVLRLDRGLPPAFAGAPLLDARGALAGMVLVGELRAAGLAAAGAGVLDVARVVARDGGIARGYLGVMCQVVRLSAPQADAAGATAGLLVVGLDEGGAAAAAGVCVGDVVLRFDEEAIADVEALHGRLSRERAGSVHRLVVLRGRSTSDLAVTLGAREGRG